MSSHPESLTQKWLRHNVQPYTHKDIVYNHINTILLTFTTLRPKSDVYTYDDGRTQLLLCVHGLLPISFRGASYNIPIAIWLTRDYPREPPISYVVPTNDMLVKANKYVDVSGRCHIEYLQHWARKSEGCHLQTLLDDLRSLFSKEPPVYAKPPETTPTQHPPRNTVTDPRGRPPPPPPLPTQNSPPRPSTSDHPQLPPKPTSTLYPQHLTFQPFQTVSSTSPDDDDRLASEPPVPPRRPLEPLPPQYRISYTAPQVPPGYTIPTSHGINSTLASYSSQTSVQGPISNISNPVNPMPSVTSPPPAPPPPPRPVSLQPEVASTSSQYTHQHRLLPNHVISQPSRTPIVNLLDEDSPETQVTSVTPVFAPPPPRPPNPELLRLHDQVHHTLSAELSSLSHALALDAERLRAQQTDLLAGEPAIRDEMARLEAVRDVCRNVAGRLKSSVQQAELNIAELRRKGDPEVDELICSTTIVHNQLISLVAEDNAIEDTIYHLHRALNSGRIDLERFLRSARLLAEEQFMKRALIQKIQEGIPIGLSMGSEWS